MNFLLRQAQTGLLHFLGLLLLITVGIGAQMAYISDVRSRVSASLVTVQDDQARANKSLTTLGYFENNKDRIRISYESYEKAGKPLTISDMAWATDVGMEEPITSFIPAFKSPGFTLASNQTEYIRFVSAAAEAEALFPLLQFSQVTMILPDGVQPMWPDPTYLDIKAECFSARQ